MKGQAALEYLMTYGWAILIAIIAVAMFSAFFRLFPSPTPEEDKNYIINGINFKFVDKIPNIGLCTEKSSGCAFLHNKTIFLINHGYVNFLQLCSHEVCHVLKNESEEVCRNTPIYYECWQLKEMIK